MFVEIGQLLILVVHARYWPSLGWSPSKQGQLKLNFNGSSLKDCGKLGMEAPLETILGPPWLSIQACCQACSSNEADLLLFGKVCRRWKRLVLCRTLWKVTLVVARWAKNSLCPWRFLDKIMMLVRTHGFVISHVPSLLSWGFLCLWSFLAIWPYAVLARL